MRWHIGCSGFSYKHWKENFYPVKVPQRLWFEYYCRFYNSVELNVTFYQFPRLETLQKWYARSPDDFIFSVKAPKAITHYKKLNDCTQMINDFYKAVSEGLQKKCGCVLFQFPPSFHYNENNLSRILESLQSTLPNVVEFRHASWWNKEVYDILGQNNITFCGMSHPSLPDDVVENNQLLYYRMHGVPQLYLSPYNEKELKIISDKIKKCHMIKNAFIYFNNDISGAALENANMMIELANEKLK